MENKYFNEALSDFMFDVASGDSIKRMVEQDYSLNQVVRELDFPTPRARVEKEYYDAQLAYGKLIEKLDVDDYKVMTAAKSRLHSLLFEMIEKDGGENSYLECDFGYIRKNKPEQFDELLSGFTEREKEYITSFPFKYNVNYLRLTGRVREMAPYIAVKEKANVRFVFTKSRRIIRVC